MTVTLFHTEGCHLCEEVEALLGRLARRHRFRLLRVDIAGDPEAYARYRYAIPVVWIDGEEVARYPVEEAALERELSRRGGGEAAKALE